MATKYSKGTEEKVEKVMHEFKDGSLKTSAGKKVTDRKQAVAIGLSEAREKGEKVPSKKEASKKATPKKNAGPKKTAVKKETDAAFSGRGTWAMG